MNKVTKQNVLQRLSVAAGHLEKVKKMVLNEDYCLDIIHQSRAVQAALKRVDEIILDGHLHTCVLKDLPSPAKKKEILARELIEVFKKKD